MLKTYLYIPEELNKKIVTLTKAKGKSKASVIREVLEKGLENIHSESNASAEVLLKIAEIGRKYNIRGPKDSSEKMDEYLWGKDWDNE